MGAQPHVSARWPLRDDLDWLMDASTTWHASLTWDLSGRWPGPSDFADLLWVKPLVSTVIDDQDGSPVALTQIVAHDPRDQCASLSMLLRPGVANDDLVAVQRCLDQLFASYGLRKMQLLVAEDHAEPLCMTWPSIDVVGRHRAHRWRPPGDFIDVLSCDFIATGRGQPSC